MAERPIDIIAQVNTGASAWETNSILRRVDERIAEEDAATKAAVDVNKNIPADLQAKAIPAAKENNIPVDVARRNLRSIEERKQRDTFFKLIDQNPSLGKLASDPAYGPVATDSAEELSDIEQRIRVQKMGMIERVGRSYVQAFEGGSLQDEASLIGYDIAHGAAKPQDIARLQEIQTELKKQVDYNTGTIAGFGEAAVGSAPGMVSTFVKDALPTGAAGAALFGGMALIGGQAGPQAAIPEEVVTVPGAMALGFGRGAIPGYIAGSYKRLFGEAFNEARTTLDINGNPLDNDTAYAIGNFAGGIGAAAEILPLEAAFKNLPILNGIVGKQGAKQLAKLAAQNPAARASLARIGRIMRTGLTEGFAEVVQEAAKLEDIIASGGVTDEDGNDLAGQRFERYTGAFAGGFAGGAVFASGAEAVTATEQKISSMRLKRAEERQKYLIELGDKIRGSKVNALSPETVIAHAQQIDADGNGPQMSAPAEKLVELFQSEGLTAEQVQARFPGLAQALDEAAQGNAEVPLNAATVVKLAQLEGFSGITGDIRTAPGEFTLNEAKARETEFDQMIEGVSAEEQKAAVRASVESELVTQFTAAGMDPKVAATNARLHATVMSRFAEGSGKTLDQLMKERQLQVTSGQDMAAADPNATMMQSIATEGITIDPATEVAPVDITTPVPDSVDWAAETRWVKDTYQGQSFEGSDGVPVRVSQISGKLASSNMGDARKAAVLRHLPEIIKNAIVYNPSVPDSQGRRNLSYAYAASVVRIANKDYAVALQYRVSGEGNRAAYQLQGFDIKERPGGKSLARPEDGRQTQPAPGRNLTIGEIVDVFKAAPLPLFQSEQGASQTEGFLASLNEREKALINPIYTNKVPAKKLKSNEAAARWLESNFVGTPIADFTRKIDDAVLREIGNVMAAEALQAMQKSGNAFDWYTSAMQRALGIVSAKWPLLSDDAAAAEAGFGTAANARFVFTYIMAVTSQNLDVAANAAATNKAFDEMLVRVKAGDYTMSKDWGTGDKQAAMGENFAKFGPLIKAMRGNDFAGSLTLLDNLFRRSMPVSDWVREMKAAGVPFNPPGQTAMDAVVYGSALLGPKIGNGFWQNLNGNFSPLTIDLWMRRTWGRLTGKSIGNESSLPTQRARLKASVARSINSPELDMDPLLGAITERRSINAKLRTLEERTDLSKKEKAAQARKLNARIKELEDIAADYRGIPVPEGWKPAYDTDSAALAAYAKRLLGVWNKEYKKLREKYGKKVPAKMQPTWARGAKRLKADLTTPLDQVANGTQRRQIETAVGYAQKTLAGLGIDVTTADLQAILWYPEKELWGALTTELAVDEDGDPVIPPSPLNESYDTVFARILNAEGYQAEQGTAGDRAGGSDGGTGTAAVGSRPGGSQDTGVPGADGQAPPAGQQVDEGPQAGPSSSGGTTLNQTAQSTTSFARGSISFTAARDKFTVTLTGKADLSTFQHEAAHYYLEVLQALVEEGSASPQMVEDLAAIKKWMGLAPGNKAGPPAKLDRRQHEQFARGWEAYLMEGRSPSADLQGVFNRFRAWMVFVYKRLTALDVELTDEVRGVFDRLVASDQEIAEARTNVGWTKPLPKEALFLTDDEYDRYVEAWNKANEEQQRAVDARLMLEAANEAKEQWKEERRKLFEEEKAKLGQTRGHRAWKLLTEGTGLGEAAPGRTTLKIDPETVPPEWRRDTTGMTEEGGLPLDAVAEILGFNSGEEMISTIAGAKFAERDLPRQVQKMMEERHGALDPAALADIAMQAVHSDKTQEVLLSEYRAMASKAGLGAAPSGMTKWMAAQAQQKVLGLTRRQLDPMRWRRAEMQAAEKSATAAAKGDATKAAVHKRQQMMAAAMYRASIAADKRVDTIRNKLMPFTKNDRRAKLGKAGDLYLDGIDQILEDIQLKPMSAASVQKLDRLQKLVEEADKNGEPLVLPDKLRAMLGKKNFQDMTLEELEGVHDAVMNIWHLAKLKNELKARAEKRELEEAFTEMEANAQAALGDRDVTVKFTEGWKDRAAARMRFVRAGLVKLEFLFGWLDGKPDGGLMHRLIYQPIADANKAKFDILQRFHETIIERMRNMPNEQKARWESKRTFMGNPTANGATIISAALNLGNLGNKQKLLEGYGWNEQRLMAEINAFMTKADWDFVQHVWDEIDTLWPKIEATTKAATGLAPEKVVASPIVTPFGTYAGGYYPVVYDPKQTYQQFKNQQESKGLFTNNFARPTLGDGFTKARVDYSAPILLKLDVISRHLAEVVHYVTHYEAVTQADKITKHPRFQALVAGHMGLEFYDTIRPWLQDVARDQDTPAITNQEPFAKAMRHLRGGVSIAAMGYNIFTGVKQLIGVVQSLDAVGPKYWLGGLSKAWLSPNAIANWKFAFNESQELRPLVTQLDRDIKMINDAYAMEGTLNMPAKVASWAFKHIGWLQAAVNVATWHGAYEQELAANNGDHERAVMHADAVVRMTQSAGAVKDLSPIQRGTEINRAVSMFYSWFNVLYNRLEDIARQTKSIRDVPKAAARVAILVMMSSMIEEAGRRAWEAVVDNYEDDEEEAGYILSVLLKSADTAIGAIPLGRVFISAEAAAGGMTPDLFPVAGVVDSYWRTARAAYDLVAEGEAPSRSEVKAAVRTVSIIGGVPLSGPYNFLDEMFGETVFGEGKKTKP